MIKSLVKEGNVLRSFHSTNYPDHTATRYAGRIARTYTSQYSLTSWILYFTYQNNDINNFSVKLVILPFSIEPRNTGESRVRVWNHMVSGARTYNGSLGADTLVRESGTKPPEAERLFALSQPEESANLS